ncbi:mannosyltransferase, partial [Lobosporangium transversale]
MSRIVALYDHYNAPIEVYRKAFDLVKVPESISGVVSIEGTAADPLVLTDKSTGSGEKKQKEKVETIRVCVGKEWYRFPSHYFLPEGAKLGFLKSHFDGLLPGEFIEMNASSRTEHLGEEKEGFATLLKKPSATDGKEHQPMRLDWRWSAERRPGTSHTPKLMNNENKEVHEHY